DDCTALVWDIASSAAPRCALTAADLTRLWEALSGSDATNGFAAEWDLAASPAEAVTLLRERLKPIRAANEAAVRKLVAQLGATMFAEREAATKALKELGDSAIGHLRAALKAGLAAEAKAGVERLLAEAESQAVPPGERQRQVRAVAVLERINND